MHNGFVAEKAVSSGGSASWVVVDAVDFTLHVESCAYLAGLRARDRSVNTERVYAGRVALYLSYCRAGGLDWANPGFGNLARFLRWLVDEPLPPRAGAWAGPPRYRSKKTANQIVTVVCEFLRFGVRYGWVSPETVAQLSEPKFLSFVPAGFNTGEDGQFRTVRAKEIRFTVGSEPHRLFTSEEFALLVAAATNARDRFLVAVTGAAALRIGETLGLCREDLHFLRDSRPLGCAVPGPHLHVRRRMNQSGALAKSRVPRSIPVTEPVVDLYAEYVFEREAVAAAAANDAVFVNLFREPLGRAMSYPNANQLFERLLRRAGLQGHLHMLRHMTATAWVRGGVDRDVVQALLGHVSPVSMDPYLHASDQDKRAAVERVALLTGWRG